MTDSWSLSLALGRVYWFREQAELINQKQRIEDINRTRAAQLNGPGFISEERIPRQSPLSWR